MSAITYSPLDTRQLLNKFYREQRSAMRAAGGAIWWVAKAPAIVAGLSLTPVADGHWLTGLLVAEGHRGQGLARGLIEAASGSRSGPVWLFCHPDLQAFYEKLDFAANPPLPVPLAERLMRYQQSKFLIAMVSCARVG